VYFPGSFAAPSSSTPQTLVLTVHSIPRKLFALAKITVLVTAIVLPLGLTYASWKTYKYLTANVTSDPRKPPQTRIRRALNHLRNPLTLPLPSKLPQRLSAYKPAILACITTSQNKDLIYRASPYFFAAATLLLFSLRPFGRWYTMGVMVLYQVSQECLVWVVDVERERVRELEREIGVLRGKEVAVVVVEKEVVGEEDGWDVCDRDE
jgi:hypothetical protein